jgi:broad specificity phosphatase PhoE
MPTVWFIRHGESEANAGLATTSPESIKLTKRGWKQAEHIARAFPTQPDIIVTSPYIRTKETAQPTLERFPASKHEKWQVQEFTYLSPSQYRDTTIAERRPLAHAYWQRLNPAHIDGEGAESFSLFIQRAQQTLTKIFAYKNEFIAIFSHEQFIRAILWIIARRVLQNNIQDIENNISAEEMQQFHQFLKAFSMPNGSIAQFTWHAGETPRPGKIITDHLPEWKEKKSGVDLWLQNNTTTLAPLKTCISI